MPWLLSFLLVLFLSFPASATSTYTVTNKTTDRTLDCDSTSIDELADVLGTLIDDVSGLTSGSGSSDITSLSGYTGNIGQEDIEWGNGLDSDTFSVQASTSGTVTLKKVPALGPTIASTLKQRWYPSNGSVGDHGDATTEGTIAWVIAQIGSAQGVIELPAGTYTLLTSIVIPTNIEIATNKGSIITGSSPVTFTCNGKFLTSGLYQVFSGTMSITFAAGAIEKVTPHMFEATPTDVGIQKAINSVGNTSTPIYVPAGTYTLAAGLSTNYPIVMRGEGARKTLFQTSNAIRMLDINKAQTVAINDIYISGIYFDGNDVATSGVELNFAAYGRFEDVEIREIAGQGLTLLGVWDMTFDGVRNMRCGHYANADPALYIGDAPKGDGTYRQSNSLRFTGHSIIERSNYSNIIIDGAAAVEFIGTKIHGIAPLNESYANTFDLVRLMGSSRTVFIGCQFVNARRYGIYMGDDSNGASSDLVMTGCTFNGIGNYNCVGTVPISGITNANPAVVTTSTAHSLINGDKVYIQGVKGNTYTGPPPALPNMNAVDHVPDGIPYTVTKIDDTHIQLDTVDTSGYHTYMSDGYVLKSTSIGEAWWIYAETGSVVANNNDFYWVDTLDANENYIPQAMSYTALGGDIYIAPTNTEGKINIVTNRYNSSAGHWHYDENANNDYLRLRMYVDLFSHNTTATLLRSVYNDGLSNNRVLWSLAANGDLKWKEDDGSGDDFRLTRSADSILELTNPAAVGCAFKSERFRANPVSGDITAASHPAVAVGDIAYSTGGGAGFTEGEGLYVYTTAASPAWHKLSIGAAASETEAGTIELATNTETITGTDATRAVTPAGLTAALGSSGTKIAGSTVAGGDLTLRGTSNAANNGDIFLNPSGGKVTVGTSSPASGAGWMLEVNRAEDEVYSQTSLQAGYGVGLLLNNSEVADQATFSHLVLRTMRNNQESDARLANVATASNTSELAILVESGGVMQEEMRIKTDKVGIGTTDPQGRIHLSAGDSKGGLYYKTFDASVDIPAAASATIQTNIPAGCKVDHVQMIVTTALTAGELWDAAWDADAGSQVIATAAAVAKNTKVNTFFDANANSDIATGEVDITITKNGGGAFTAAGTIEAIGGYWCLHTVTDIP